MWTPITLAELTTGELLTVLYDGPDHPAYDDAVRILRARAAAGDRKAKDVHALTK